MLSEQNANPKSLHTVWFPLYNILGMTKLQKSRPGEWLPKLGTGEGGMGGGCGSERATEETRA